MHIGCIPAPKNNERYQDIGVTIAGTRNIFHPEETDIILVADNPSGTKTIVTIKTDTSFIEMMYSILSDYDKTKDARVFGKFNNQEYSCQYGIIKDGVKISGLRSWRILYDKLAGGPVINILNDTGEYLVGLVFNEKTKLELTMLYCNIMKIDILNIIGHVL